MFSPVGQNAYLVKDRVPLKFLHFESKRKSLINGTYVYRTWKIRYDSESTECNFDLNR